MTMSMSGRPEGRLRIVLLTLRIAALLVAVALPITLTSFWLFVDPSGVSALVPLPGKPQILLGNFERIAGLSLSMLPAGILIFGLIRLRAYLAALLQGAIFSGATSRALKDFALAVGASVLARPIISAVLSVVLTWSAPPGQQTLSFSLSLDTVLLLIFAATIGLAAWTMQLATAIAEENSRFV